MNSIINRNRSTTNYNNNFSGTIILIIAIAVIAIIVPYGLFSRGECVFQIDRSALAAKPETQEHINYLPIIFKLHTSASPIVNLPDIENEQGEFLPEEAAAFGFGRVTPIENYTDIRVGYTQTELWVRVSVFDRRLWYDPSPTLEDLTNWDSVSLFLDTGGDTFRFDAQMNWWEERDQFQASYQLINGNWTPAPITFLTDSVWWGFPQPNDDQDDRAWAIAFSIPYLSLGYNEAPAEGTEWRLGFQVYDRDDSIGTPIPTKYWPDSLLINHPLTWGVAHFGLPEYTIPQASNPQNFTLRNGFNGITVTDGMVGGGTVCGDGLDFWNEWGDFSYLGSRALNVQNQGNTDDWPCFSKIYMNFPLDSLPLDKEVITATLTLHQLGNSIGFPYDPPKALNSLIQVWQINQDWDPNTLSWNNSPQPVENISRSWLGSIYPGDPDDLGIARTWDVSILVAEAYDFRKPLQMLLYSADFYGPHGKYFFSSSSDDWAGAWRPSLTITLGNP